MKEAIELYLPALAEDGIPKISFTSSE